MTKVKRQIEKTDLIPSDVYSSSRKEIRKELVVAFLTLAAVILAPGKISSIESA